MARKLIKLVKQAGKEPSAKVLTLKTRRNLKNNSKAKQFTAKKSDKYKSPVLNQLSDFLSTSENKNNVIIDGCNVGFAHGKHKHFSIEGMETCIKHFENLGHPTVAVVPERRRHNCNNPSLLQELHSEKKVVFAPFDNEYGRCTDTYDDKCILGLAEKYDGIVVSNDNYRDIINHSSGWRNVIENRVVPFCFFKDMFIIPRDPYGPGRPSLEQILNKK